MKALNVRALRSQAVTPRRARAVIRRALVYTSNSKLRAALFATKADLADLDQLLDPNQHDELISTTYDYLGKLIMALERKQETRV